MEKWNLTQQLLLLNLDKGHFAAGRVMSLNLADLSQLGFKGTNQVKQ